MKRLGLSANLDARTVMLGGLLLALAAPALGGCGAKSSAEVGKSLLPVGSVAPEVVGVDQNGRERTLSERKGRLSVVYFYPKDQTPGCTTEACAFRDNYRRFQALGMLVFAVSRDSNKSHAEFRERYKLPFIMVGDESGKLQHAYGVPDRLPGIASRVTFLIGRDGKIARIWPDVDPAVNASEVLAAAHSLTSSW